MAPLVYEEMSAHRGEYTVGEGEGKRAAHENQLCIWWDSVENRWWDTVGNIYSGIPSDTYGGIPSVKVKVAAPVSPTREMCAQTVESHPNVGEGEGHAACTAH